MPHIHPTEAHITCGNCLSRKYKRLCWNWDTSYGARRPIAPPRPACCLCGNLIGTGFWINAKSDVLEGRSLACGVVL